MDKEKRYTECFNNYKNHFEREDVQMRKNALSILGRIQEVEIKTGKYFYDFDKEDIFRMFKGELLDSSTLKSYKTHMLKFLEYLAKENVISEIEFQGHVLKTENMIMQEYINSNIVANKIKKRYFFSEDEFINYILRLYSPENLKLEDTSLYDIRIIIMFLLWLGFTKEEIPEIKARDFDIKERRISGVEINNHIIFNTFVEYSKKLEYKKFVNGEFITYRYIINDKFVKGLLDEVKVSTVTWTLQTTNKLIKETDISELQREPINFKLIKLSKEYINAYKSKQLNRNASAYAKTLKSREYQIWEAVKIQM